MTRVERRECERAMFHADLEVKIFFGMMFAFFIGVALFC